MYNVLFLTERDQMSIDPTGRGRATIASFKEGEATPIPRILKVDSREDAFSRYLAVRSQVQKSTSKHNLYWAFDDSNATKYGAQGDTFALDEIQSCYARSYTNAEYVPSWHPKLLAGRDLFLRELDQAIESFGYPQINFEEMGVTGTSAALPTMARKGSFAAETCNMTSWRHVFYNLPGQRSMRLKHRTINQDANANVRYIEPHLSAVRKWLCRYVRGFDAWANPAERLAPCITQMLRRQDSASVETDYDACDEHFSLDVVEELILPVYEKLIPFKMEFLRLAAFVEELFYQPIYFGDYAWTGKHNLLSGQVITNDFETIFDNILARAGLLGCAGDRYRSYVCACGDDMAVIVPKKSAQRVYDALVEYSELAGMKMSLAKCRIDTEKVEFCRKIYYLGLPCAIHPTGESYIVGAYPSILSFNNIINPERFIRDEAELWKATFQRLDNVYGAPWFHTYVQFVGKLLKRMRVSSDEIEAATSYDWWERVYGQTWSLSSSPSYKILQAAGFFNS